MGRLTRALVLPPNTPAPVGAPALAPAPSLPGRPGKRCRPPLPPCGQGQGRGAAGPNWGDPLVSAQTSPRSPSPRRRALFLKPQKANSGALAGTEELPGLRHKGPHPPRAALPSALSSTPAGSPHPPPSPPLMELPISRFPGPRGSQTGAPRVPGEGGEGGGGGLGGWGGGPGRGGADSPPGNPHRGG